MSASSSFNNLLNRFVQVAIPGSRSLMNPFANTFDPANPQNQIQPFFGKPFMPPKPAARQANKPAGYLIADGQKLAFNYPPSEQYLRNRIVRLKAEGVKDIQAQFKDSGSLGRAWKVLQHEGYSPQPQQGQEPEFEKWRSIFGNLGKPLKAAGVQAPGIIPLGAKKLDDGTASAADLRALVTQELKQMRESNERISSVSTKLQAIKEAQAPAETSKPKRNLATPQMKPRVG